MTFCSDFDSLDRFALTLIVLTDTNVVSQGFVGESLLPAGPENFGQKVQSGDDMLVEGYPRGLLIQENIYPIIKSSCVSASGVHISMEIRALLLTGVASLVHHHV